MPPAKQKPVLETDFVRALGELLNDLSLAEIAYEKGDFRVRVTRQQAAMAPLAAPAVTVTEAARPAAAVGAPSEDYGSHPGLLTAPMVGVVYTSAEPGSPAYVSLGDTVAVGDTVLLIEAMKVFNPIKAHRAGRISRVFISNGVPVEYGEPLLLID
ncbi:MAG: acetyl-CoA carboxylase biotin carboxyl carrier protein [Rhodospirillales bacterium]|nr:acetyl-CoA carboxylase biotin carboxyl carrier protein [Rhodospirillales bacterium]